MIPKSPLLRKIEAFAVPLIVVLVGVGAFGLGRLSALGAGGAAKGELKIYQREMPAASAAALERNYVASKSGTRYYLPNCSGVSRINEENKVWFATAEAAQASGYTPAAGCPGL